MGTERGWGSATDHWQLWVQCKPDCTERRCLQAGWPGAAERAQRQGRACRGQVTPAWSEAAATFTTEFFGLEKTFKILRPPVNPALPKKIDQWQEKQVNQSGHFGETATGVAGDLLK